MTIYYLPQLPSKHSEYFLQNKYTKWYFSIISRALTRGLTKPRRDDPDYIYYEAHHILPKCKSMFPEYESFKLFPWNKVLLTGKEHYICHLLLYKMTEGKIKGLMYVSLHKMKNNPKNKMSPSRSYEFFRIHWAESIRGEGSPMYGKNRIMSKETRLKISQSSKGRIFTEEHKRKLSESMKKREPVDSILEYYEKRMGTQMSKLHTGVPKTEEHKRKLSESNKGKHSNLGEKNPFYNRQHKESTKKYLSNLMKSKVTCPKCGREDIFYATLSTHLKKCN